VYGTVVFVTFDTYARGLRRNRRGREHAEKRKKCDVSRLECVYGEELLSIAGLFKITFLRIKGHA